MSIRRAAILVIPFVLLAGCASVTMESKEKSDVAKKFSQPSSGNAGIYVFREGGVGGALKRNLWVDGKCIGASAPNVFFFEEVRGGSEHTVSTESEFSPNDLMVKTAAGSNYFIRQYMKMGVFVGGAGLELVSEEVGKGAVSKLELAQKGNCSKAR